MTEAEEKEETLIKLRKENVRLGKREIGSTGLIMWGGMAEMEFLQQLRGMRGIRVYQEMKDNDAVIGAFLTLIDLMVRKVTWRVEPADASQAAGRAAELVETALDRMAFTWRDTLSEILSFLVYGWAYFENVYQKRPDGLIGWKKWAIRGQDTLSKWEIDDEGGIQGMYQQAAPKFEEKFIPIDVSTLFRTRIERNNPQGRSILRNCYRTWYMKKRIEEIEGIGIERGLAGIPVLTPPEDLDLWNVNDPEASTRLAQAEQVVRNIRRDQHEGIVKPYGWVLELLTTATRAQFDINETLNRMDKRLAMTALAEFIMLGSEGVGSFALASSKISLFSVATGSYIDIIADLINRYPIPRLMALNGIKEEMHPKLCHGDVEKVDLTELTEALFKLAGIGMEIFPNDKLEEHLFSIMRLPYMKPEEREAMHSEASLKPPKQKDTDGMEEGKETGSEAAGSSVDAKQKE